MYVIMFPLKIKVHLFQKYQIFLNNLCNRYTAILLFIHVKRMKKNNFQFNTSNYL